MSVFANILNFLFGMTIKFIMEIHLFLFIVGEVFFLTANGNFFYSYNDEQRRRCCFVNNKFKKIFKFYIERRDKFGDDFL